MSERRNLRLLVVDDNPSIHEDFRKVLSSEGGERQALADLEQELFGAETGGAAPPPAASECYEIDCARQGEEALELVLSAQQAGRPYALTFMDVRMPPGWDGVETLARLWQVDPDLQAVICTANSDYTWSETIARLGRNDRLLVLKKPFDAIEVCQMASALVEKWNVTQSERLRIEGIRAAEREARAYAASLQTVNHALEDGPGDGRGERRKVLSLPAYVLVITPSCIRLVQPIIVLEDNRLRAVHHPACPGLCEVVVYKNLVTIGISGGTSVIKKIFSVAFVNRCKSVLCVVRNLKKTLGLILYLQRAFGTR